MRDNVIVAIIFLGSIATLFSTGVSAAESAVIARFPDKKSASRVYADGRIEPLPFVGTGKGSGALFAGEDFPAPSPDGRYVAYVRDGTLRLFDATTNRDRQIFPSEGSDNSQKQEELLITGWSVAGTKLLYYRPSNNPRVYWVYDISRDASARVLLPGGFVSWVQDDEFILEETDKSGRKSILRWRMGDVKPRLFLAGPDDYSQFRRSRDGQNLAALLSAPGRSQIVRIDVRDGSITPITPPGKWAEYQWPVLSPSGKRTAYFHRTETLNGIISGDVVVDGKPIAKYTHYGKLEWINERIISIRDSCSFRVVDAESKAALATQPVPDGFSGPSAVYCQDGVQRITQQKQAQGFDYQGYPVRDLDEVIATAPAIRSITGELGERKLLPDTKSADLQTAANMDIIRPQKMRLQVVLDAWPEPVTNKTPLPQPPHEYALRAIGWNPPPPANFMVRVRSTKGRVLAMHIQDALVPALKKEIKAGEKVTLYCLLFYYDKNGPGIIINEFARE